MAHRVCVSTTCTNKQYLHSKHVLDMIFRLANQSSRNNRLYRDGTYKYPNKSYAFSWRLRWFCAGRKYRWRLWSSGEAPKLLIQNVDLPLSKWNASNIGASEPGSLISHMPKHHTQSIPQSVYMKLYKRRPIVKHCIPHYLIVCDVV